MNWEEKIRELELRISKLATDKRVLENLLVARVPEWAVEPLNIANQKGNVQFPFIKPNTFGSYDYYRILALLAKNNII